MSEPLDDIERQLRAGFEAWYAAHDSDTGARFMGADGPFYKVVQATLNRLAVRASASTPEHCPGCSGWIEPEYLRREPCPGAARESANG